MFKLTSIATAMVIALLGSEHTVDATRIQSQLVSATLNDHDIKNKITDSNFIVREDRKPTLVEFMQPSCPNCLAVEDAMAKIKENYSEKLDVEKYNCVETSYSEGVCSMLNITGTPIFLLAMPGDNFKEGFRFNQSLERNYANLSAWIDSHIAD